MRSQPATLYFLWFSWRYISKEISSGWDLALTNKFPKKLDRFSNFYERMYFSAFCVSGLERLTLPLIHPHWVTTKLHSSEVQIVSGKKADRLNASAKKSNRFSGPQWNCLFENLNLSRSKGFKSGAKKCETNEGDKNRRLFCIPYQNVSPNWFQKNTN